MKLSKKSERLLAATPGLHLHRGKLRLAFRLPGQRRHTRRSLGLDPTDANIQYAARLLGAIKQDISFGRYSADPAGFWQAHFPNSPTHLPTDTDTFTAAASRYLEQNRLQWSANYFSNLRGAFRVVSIHIGHTPLNEITTDHLQAMQRALLASSPHRPDTGCSPTTINNYMSKAAMVLKDAVDREELGANPFDKLSRLKADRGAITEAVRPFSTDEVARLVAASGLEQERDAIIFLAHTGVRPGELAALAWEDVDLEEGTALIRYNLDAYRHLKLPKTTSGERELILLPEALEVLKRQRARTFFTEAMEEVIHLRYGKTRTELRRRVFWREQHPGSRGGGSTSGPYTRPQIFANRRWHDLVRRAGIKYREPYQLRHTFASWMLMAGADPMFVAEQMGHSDWGMIRQTYGKWIPDEGKHRMEFIKKLPRFDPISTPHGGDEKDKTAND